MMAVRPDLRPSALLDLSQTVAAELFTAVRWPWEVLPLVAGLVERLLADPPPGYSRLSDTVIVGEGARIAPSAHLVGPAVIGPGCEVRHGAFVRENVVAGAGCVIGNSSEVKNAILFDHVQIPHFNYAGDSILGAWSHLGAGAILSNFKSDGSPIAVLLPDGSRIETGLVKFGAVLGDRVEIGCNSVCCPGTVVGRDATAYPLSFVRGVLPESTILKHDGAIVPKRRAP